MNSEEQPKYLLEIKETKEQYDCPFNYLPSVTKDLDSLSKDFSSDDIYRVTLWKINRYIEDTNAVAELVNSSASTKDLRQHLEELLKKRGVGLPMASTYLRFRNPKKFQIIDVRAFRMAFDFNPGEYDTKHKCFPALGTAGYEVYNKYLKKLKEISKSGYHGISVEFCQLDRFLYDVDKAFGHALGDGKPSPEWEKVLKLKDEKKQADFIMKKMEEYNKNIKKIV